jgi:hypothetical protein
MGSMSAASGRGGRVAPARSAADREKPAAAVVSSTVFAQAAFANQKLIRTAEAHIEVDSVERAIQRIDSLARQNNAFVADVNLSNAERFASARLVIRVPSAQFTTMVASLATLGKVTNQALATEDVTREYADLETRLGVKEQTVGRLRNLLATRTGQLDDVLNVERELARVVTELEQLKGERNYYDQRVAVSTISVSLSEPNLIASRGFSPNIGTAFTTSIRMLANFASGVISAITFLIPWLAVAGLGWLISKRFRLMRRAM